MINYKILAAARKEKGVTWKFLEDTIDGYRGKFLEYSHSKTTFTSDEEFKIAKALDVSLEYLCGKSDQKNKPTVSKDDELIREQMQKVKLLPKEVQKQVLDYIDFVIEHQGK